MHIYKAIKEEMLVPIHPAGWPFILLFVAVTLAIGSIETSFFVIGAPLCLWCVYFFRNPPRAIPQAEGWVISPADGRILSVEKLDPPAEMQLPAGDYQRIAIFMNVFDVHVNRLPMAGRIDHISYHKGKFLNASLDKASVDNERNALTITTDFEKNGKPFQIGFVQIAGLVARRILCDVNIGDKRQAGDVFGLIRFGSRVDVWIPADWKVLVAGDQRAVAGETVLADATRKEGKTPLKAMVK